MVIAVGRSPAALSRASIVFLAFIASDHLAHVDVWADVTISDVLVPAGGIAIAARVYERPSSLGSRPGVVLLHGYMGNMDMMEASLACDLARRGFVVLSMSYPGHGNSGGGIRSSRSTERLRENRLPEEPAVVAALSALASQAHVDPKRIAVVGHSEGGKAGLAVSAENEAVGATVMIAGTAEPQLFGPHAPKNLLLLFGQHDGATLERLRKLPGAETWVREPNTTFGNHVDGSARRLEVMSGLGHLDVLFDEQARRRTVTWLEQSVGPLAFWQYDIRPLPLRWLFFSLGCVAVLAAESWRFIGRHGYVLTAPHSPETHFSLFSKLGRYAARLVAFATCMHVAAIVVFPALHPWLGWLPFSGGPKVFALLWSVFAAILLERVLWRLIGTRFHLGLTAPWRAVAVGVVTAALSIAALAHVTRGYYDLASLSASRLTLVVMLVMAILPVQVAWLCWCDTLSDATGLLRPSATGARIVPLGVATWVLSHDLGIYFTGAHEVFFAVGLMVLIVPSVVRELAGGNCAMANATFSSGVCAWLLAMTVAFT